MSLFAETILPRSKDRSLLLWAGAAVLILAAHVGVAFFFLVNHASETIGKNAPDAIFIDLAPLPVAPAQQQVDTPEPEPMKEEPPPETLPQEKPPEPAPMPELPQVPKAEVEVPVKHEDPKPLPKKEQPKKVVAKKPEAKPVTRSERPERARTQSAPATVSSAAAANWKGELYARLKQFQHYPEAARSHGETGTASISFTIDRNGRIVAARLVASSGSSILDQEALATVRRASPMPAPPSGATVTISVPMRYSLR